MLKTLVLLVTLVCAVACLPLETSDLKNVRPAVSSPEVRPAVSSIESRKQVVDLPAQAHVIQRRFINPLFSLGTQATDDIIKMRTKRSYDECEKLQLCKLHARSRQSFFAAYELYFVNKENAHLWDHRARSMAECERRFGDCYYK